MRSFNANFVTEKNKRADGPKPINLLTFAFATPVYLSDRDITPSGGSAHKGLVKSWGFIDSSITQTPGSGVLGSIEICDLQLTIINAESPRFSDNFTAADPPENVIVTLYQWFGGLLYSEKEIIFKGIIYGQPRYDEYACTLTVRGIFEKYNKKIGEDMLIDVDTYPNADPDDIGKMSNICYGTLPNVPCRSVAAGAVDTLTEDLADGALTFTVSGSSKIAFPAGTVVVQIDDEQISGTYTTATRTFSSCTRGYNSTIAAFHNKGASVAEVLSVYVYEIAGHPVKAIDAVYVDGVLQDAAIYTAYTGQTGDELTGYEGKAVVEFTVLPVVRKQINLGVDEGSHTHSDSNTPIITWDFDTAAFGSGGGSNADNAVDGNLSTYATCNMSAYVTMLTVSRGASYSNAQAPVRMRLGIKKAAVYSVSAKFEFCGASTGWVFGTGTFWGDWVTLGAGYDSWAEIKAASGVVSRAVTAAQDIYEVMAEIQCATTISDSAATGVALTGNSTAETVIGKLVTADVDGYQDDGSYTGTSGALIERCSHVFLHAWCELVGAPSADIDVTTYNAADTFYGANGYKFALLINSPIAAADLFMRLALQCRSRFFVTPAGTAKLIVRQLGQASGHAIVKNEIKRDSMSIERSPTTEIINLFNIHHALDLTKSAGDPQSYAASKNFQDATSITRYGQREWKGSQDVFCFNAVRDADMAEDVGDFLLSYHDLVRKMPHFSVFLDNMEIEPGDLIDVTHPLDAMSGFVCEAQKILHHLGNTKQIDYIEVVGVEN